MVDHRFSFSDNLQKLKFWVLFVDLTCCHGNRHDVTSTLKVLPNNRVAKIFIVCPQDQSFFSFKLSSFHKHYGNVRGAKAFDCRSQRSSGKAEALRCKRSTVLLVQGIPNWAYTKGGTWECGFSLVSCNLWRSTGEHSRPPVFHFVHKWSAGRSCLRLDGCTLRRRHQAIPTCFVCRTLWPHTRHSL